jgi:hypothetical protein
MAARPSTGKTHQYMNKRVLGAVFFTVLLTVCLLIFTLEPPSSAAQPLASPGATLNPTLRANLMLTATAIGTWQAELLAERARGNDPWGEFISENLLQFALTTCAAVLIGGYLVQRQRRSNLNWRNIAAQHKLIYDETPETISENFIRLKFMMPVLRGHYRGQIVNLELRGIRCCVHR